MRPYGKMPPAEVNGPGRLHFGTNNAKLRGSRTADFALPAGYSCPGACKCLAWFDREEGKIHDGPDNEYRCYAASQEAAFPGYREAVARNLARLKEARTPPRMAELIDLSLPGKYFHNIRVHSDGDFFNWSYFNAWMLVAHKNDHRLFYAYTKSLPMWLRARKEDLIPENFVLTASRGGKWDDLIEPNGLRCAHVVFHPDEAEAMGLEIDHDDSHARSKSGEDFCLLLHGTQPGGTEASKAIVRMKKEGVRFSYGKGPK